MEMVQSGVEGQTDCVFAQQDVYFFYFIHFFLCVNLNFTIAKLW